MMSVKDQEFATPVGSETAEVIDTMADRTEALEGEQVQTNVYQKCLELDGQKAEALAEIDGVTEPAAYPDDVSDEDLEQLYEKLLERPAEERSEAEAAWLSQAKERYIKMKFYRQFQEARRWFETEYPAQDFDALVSSDLFLEFASGVRLPIRELLRRYVMLHSTPRAKPRGAGSVRSNGPTVAKDYFTPDEVDRMSEKEIAQNLEVIKKSMTKWN